MTATVALGEQKQIDVGAIEQELAALWKQANTDDGPHTTRACVMTLVVPVAGQRAANDVTSVVARLTDRFPNRAIVVDAVSDAPESMEAWVQAHCQLPAAGSSQICCEQISIEARGRAVERVAGTVLPLLVPDVPVVLWWSRGTPANSTLFTRLAPFSDRVLVDSATFEQPEQQMCELTQMFNQLSVSDLTWGRLTPWRELTAQFFDSPNTVGHVREIEQVRVQYRPHANGMNRLQPLLFVGWLAAKLGWKASATAGATVDAAFMLSRPDGGQVAVQFIPDRSESGSSQLTKVELRCTRAQYSITRDQALDCAIATAQAGASTAMQRVVHLEHPDLAGLLTEELRLFGRDTSYQGALQAAAALIG